MLWFFVALETNVGHGNLTPESSMHPIDNTFRFLPVILNSDSSV